MEENKEVTQNENAEALTRPKKKKGGLIITIILIVLLAGGTIAFSAVKMMKSMKDMKSAMTNSDNDGTYKVERQDIKQEIVSSGTIIGTEKKAYTSPVTAKVDKVFVEVGQVVKKGDVLLSYDASNLGDDLVKVKLQAQSQRAAGNESFEQAGKAAGKVSEAKEKIKELKNDIKKLKKEIEDLNDKISKYEAKLNAAGANEAANGEMTTEGVEANTPVASGLTDKEEKEYKKLASELKKKSESLATKQAKLAEQEGIVSANEDVKVSESMKTQIDANNQLSDMSVSEAQESYDKAEAGIVAAADGIVESVDIVEGAFANETQSLVTVLDDKKIGVEFSVAKDDLGSITPGQKARVDISGKQYDGKVDFISRVAVNDAMFASTGAGTAGIKGRIVLDNPDDNIFIGVTAKVYVFVGESNNALVVPYEALCMDVDGDFVYVVNDENLIERKDVVVGIYSDEYYEILEGISEGDRVITNVTKDMKPGDTYTPPASVPTGLIVG